MFNAAGQIDHLTFAGLRGGGGKSGGSGYSTPAAAPTYTDPATGMTFSSPDALNAEIAQNQQNAAAAQAAAQAQAQATAAQNEATFQTNKQQAYNDALQSVMQTFQGQGVNPANYMGYITPQLQQISNTIPDLAATPGSYFPSSLGQTILNQATSDARTQANNALNSIFTPTYTQSMLPSSIMTQPISDILSAQFDPLSTQLTNALNRNTLNQVGYNAAVAKMNQDKAAAQSQLQSLGQNILTADQASLGNIVSGARSDAANLSLGQTFDPSAYSSQGSQQAAQDIQGFGGALQNAAGNVTFADIQDLLNAGGAVQGATNPTAANPLGAPAGVGTGAVGAGGVSPSVATDTTAQDASQRGLGTTGAF